MDWDNLCYWALVVERNPRQMADQDIVGGNSFGNCDATGAAFRIPKNGWVDGVSLWRKLGGYRFYYFSYFICTLFSSELCLINIQTNID